MEQFSWTPDFGLTRDSTPRIRIAKFGDGYEQRVLDGLNNLLPTWAPKFSGKTLAFVEAVESFLIRHGGTTAFRFPIPETSWSASGVGVGIGTGLQTQYQLARLAAAPQVDETGLTWPVDSVPRYNDVRATHNPALAPWEAMATGTGIAPMVTPDYGIAPDGTATAALVEFDAGAGTAFGDESALRQFNTSRVVLQPVVFSVWLRTADGSTRLIRGTDGANTSSVVTGDWQRFAWQTTGGTVEMGSSACALRVIGASAAGTSRSARLLMWGPQVELGTEATRFIPNTSTSTPATAIPAFLGDAGSAFVAVRTPWTTRPTLISSGPLGTFRLSETRRRNLLPQSTAFGGGNWDYANMSATSGLSSPDGGTNATQFIPDDLGGTTSIVQLKNTGVAGLKPGRYTFSCYLRNDFADIYTYEYMMLRVRFANNTDLRGSWTRAGEIVDNNYTAYSGNSAAPVTDVVYHRDVLPDFDPSTGLPKWYRASMSFTCTENISYVALVGSWDPYSMEELQDGQGGFSVYGPMLERDASDAGRYLPNAGAPPAVAAGIKDYDLLSSGIVVLTEPLADGTLLTFSGAGTDVRNVVCDRWSRSYVGPDNYTLQADFREVPA